MRRHLFVGCIALGAVGCSDIGGADRLQPGFLVLNPELSTTTASVAIRQVRITLRPVGEGNVIERLFEVAPGQESFDEVVEISVSGDGADFELTVTLFDEDGVEVYRNVPDPQLVRVVPGLPTGEPVPVVLQYIGPGADAAFIEILGGDVTVVVSDVVTLTAVARNNAEQPTNPPITWEVLDDAAELVSADGPTAVIRGVTVGVARIRASTPTGVEAITTVAVVAQSVPVVGLTGIAETVSEGDDPQILIAILNEPASANVILPFTLSGTATTPADYMILPNPIVIPAGMIMAPVTFTVVDDELVEGNETVVITLGTPQNAVFPPGTPTEFTATIIDNDAAVPEVSFGADAQAVSEQAGAVPVLVTLSEASDVEVTVAVGLDGTAAPAVDFTFTDVLVTFEPGQVVSEVTVTVVDDNIDEPDETVILTLSAPTNATIGEMDTHTTTILDDEPLPVIALAAPIDDAVEGDAPDVNTVVLSHPSSQVVSLSYTLSGTATTPDDYSITPNPIVLAPGETETLVTLVVVDDLLVEGDESVTVTLDQPVNAVLPPESDIITFDIIDNDVPQPTVSFEGTGGSVNENDEPFSLIVSLSEITTQDVTVPFTVTGTATDGTDFTITGSPVLITAGNVGTSIDISPLDDLIDELDETVIVTLGTPTNAQLGANFVNTVTILDDDPTPSVSFQAPAGSIDENDEFFGAILTLSSPSVQDVVVPFTVGGTATPGTDYTISGSPVTIPAGSQSATIDVSPIDDDIDELNEDVVIQLGTPTNAQLGAISQGTVTILDDDPLPIVGFNIVTSQVTEDVGMIQAIVTLTNPSSLDVGLGYTLGGTAQDGVDYRVAPNPVVIPAGEVTATVTITVVDDVLDEDDETVIVGLLPPTNAQLPPGLPTQFTITIIDNDPPPVVSFVTSSGPNLSEPSTLVLNMTLSVPSGRDITVSMDFGQGQGFADFGDDYTITVPVFPAGATNASFQLIVLDDTTTESVETIQIIIVPDPTYIIGQLGQHVRNINANDIN